MPYLSSSMFHLILQAAIASRISLRSLPFSVNSYLIRIGVSGITFLLIISTLANSFNFADKVLELIGLRFIRSSLNLISLPYKYKVFMIIKFHLLPIILMVFSYGQCDIFLGNCRLVNIVSYLKVSFFLNKIYDYLT